MTHRGRGGDARRGRTNGERKSAGARSAQHAVGHRETYQPARADDAPADRVAVARALSKLGAGSRRDGERWVAEGRVRVNGHVVRDPTFRIDPRHDAITLDGERVRPAARRYFALHKPRGVVVSRVDERGAPSVYSLLPADLAEFVAPVGRLDRASEGLLLFTNDTRWADALLAPTSHVPKTYHVQIDVRPDPALLARLIDGIDVPDGEHLAVADARTVRTSDRSGWLELVLHEGRNRHIRRMLAAVGVEVRRLIRVAIGPLQLGNLQPGSVRLLTTPERDALARATAVRTPSPR